MHTKNADQSQSDVMTNEKAPSKQMWELLSSPGHVLLAQMQALSSSRPHMKGIKMAAFGLVLLLILDVAAPYINATLSNLTNPIAGLVGKVFIDKGSKTPNLKTFSSNIPVLQQSDIIGLTSVQDVRNWIESSLGQLNGGGTPEYCLKKDIRITDSWFVGNGSQPACRTSKEKNRIWVWSIAKSGPEGLEQAVPFAGVFKRDTKMKWSFYALQEAGVNWPGYEMISAKDVPRSLATDLPELEIEGGKS